MKARNDFIPFMFNVYYISTINYKRKMQNYDVDYTGFRGGDISS